MMQGVLVYGTTWSVASWDIRRLLDELSVPYRFVDLDADASARAWAEELGHGQYLTVVPLVHLADGTLLPGASRQQVARHFGVNLDTGLLRPLPVEVLPGGRR